MPAPDTNDVYLTGELLDDPAFREIAPSNLPVGNVKLGVVERSYTNQDNARTFAVALAFYGPYTDLLRPFRKGARVFVKGAVSVRSTSKTTTSTTTEIVVHELRPLQEMPVPNTQSRPGAADVKEWG